MNEQGKPVPNHWFFIYRMVIFFPAILFYVGFLTLNGHLSEYNILDFNFVNARLLISGSLFSAYFLLWFVMVGNPLVTRDKDFDEEIEFAKQLGNSKFWVNISKNHFYFRLAFFSCIPCIALSLLFTNKLSTFILLLCFSPGLFIYILNSINDSDIRFGQSIWYFRIKIVIEMLLFLAAFLLFSIYLFPIDPMFHLYVLTFIWSISTMAFDRSLTWFGVKDALPRNLVLSILIVGGSAFSFGKSVYEHIDFAFGGGQLLPVEVIITDESTKTGLSQMGFKVEPYLDGKLINENSKEIFVFVNGQSLRFSRNNIGSIRMLPIQSK